EVLDVEATAAPAAAVAARGAVGDAAADGMADLGDDAWADDARPCGALGGALGASRGGGALGGPFSERSEAHVKEAREAYAGLAGLAPRLFREAVAHSPPPRPASAAGGRGRPRAPRGAGAGRRALPGATAGLHGVAAALEAGAAMGWRRVLAVEAALLALPVGLHMDLYG
ncbi:unnamed protein product, partial [Prorocentrum cordatum]